jgi:hypothetical protein
MGVDLSSRGVKGLTPHMKAVASESKMPLIPSHTHPRMKAVAEVGTRYFFRSLLLLVRYLKIVLPLRAGPLFRYRYFFRSALPLARSSAIPLPLLSL